MKIPITLLKSMDKNGSYKESDLLFKIALDLSELEPNNASGAGSYGNYYSDKNKIQQTLQQMGVKHSNPGVKLIHIPRQRYDNTLEEILGMNIIAPLINQHTQLVAPIVPQQSISSILSTGVMATQHFDGITGKHFRDHFDTSEFGTLFATEVITKIATIITKELKKVGITYMDMHDGNFIIKSRLFTELKTLYYDLINESKTLSLNVSGLIRLISQALLKIDFNKKICVFDFGMMEISGESLGGEALMKFKKTLEKYKNKSHYVSLVSDRIDSIMGRRKY